MIDVVPGVELIIMGYAFEDNGGPIDAGDISVAPNLIKIGDVHEMPYCSTQGREKNIHQE